MQKMSTARLIAKLTQEGIGEDELDKMSRKQLMASCYIVDLGILSHT